MARAAVILAWLDDAYRRNPPRDGVRRVAARLAGGAPPTWEDCAADVEDSLAREVRGLMEVAEREFGAVDRVGAIGPEFVGSPYVGGADADLLLDHRLVEVKTTIRPGRELLRASRQMLGYILLDWSDEHEMEGAGFYFARQGELVSWPLSSLLEETTGDSTATVKALRLEFRQLAEKAGVQRRRGPRGSIPEAP